MQLTFYSMNVPDGCTDSQYWNRFVYITCDLLWAHSELTPTYHYVNEIIFFMNQEMDIQLLVISWAEPLDYYINPEANPATDLRKLINFIDENLSTWNNDFLITTYRNCVKIMLDKYLTFCNEEIIEL